MSAQHDPLPPLPDVREEEGWVFSSMPVRLILEDGGVNVPGLYELCPATPPDEQHRLRKLPAAQAGARKAP